MKIKLGFTITEVLLTMATIGVVAALTAPLLISGVSDKKVCTKLAKFNNTFSTAIEAVMSENHIREITRDNLNQVLESLITDHIEMFNYEQNYEYTSGAKTNKSNIAPNNSHPYQIKDGTVVVFVQDNQNNANGNFAPYRGPVADIIVDVNGIREPNIAGSDIFGFILDGSGILIPAGSKLQQMTEMSGVSLIGAYSSTCSRSSSTLNENFACTGQIADNNWSTKGLSMK